MKENIDEFYNFGSKMIRDGKIKENRKYRQAQAKKVFLKLINLLALNIDLHIWMS